jgi:hypothetical protein
MQLHGPTTSYSSYIPGLNEEGIMRINGRLSEIKDTRNILAAGTYAK